MPKYFSIVFLLILSMYYTAECSGQKYNNNWVFGIEAGIDFNTNPPTKRLNDSIQSPEGCTTISDPNTGELLFYSDGDTIYNRNHQVMPNGIGLGGHYSTTQGVLAVPDPGNLNKYYLFTVYAQAGNPVYCCGSGGLNYNIVDMTLDGGLGDVTVKNQVLLTPTSEKLCATKQCNNKDYWIVVHKWGSDEFYSYPLTSAGIGSPVISAIGVIHQDLGSNSNYESIGYMRISPNGKRLASVCSQEINKLQVFDFDDNTGIVSNLLFTDSAFTNVCGLSGLYGACFSPNSDLLYVSTNIPGAGCADISGVFQYDLSLINSAAILGSKTLIDSNQTKQYGALQIGLDGRIYIAIVTDSRLDVINNPNAYGAACNYQTDAFNLNTFAGNHICIYGLPNFVESFANPKTKCYLKFQGCTQLDSILVLDTILQSPYSFSWNFGDPSSGANNISTNQNPSHNFSIVDEYTVTLTVFSPCDTFTITKIIDTKGSLIVNTGPDTLICLGESYQIETTGGANYVWSPTTGLSCTDCANPIATPLLNTTYIVNVSAASPGCVDADTIIINLTNATIANAFPDTSICLGQTVQLQSSGGTSYQWYPNDSISNINISNPLINPSQTVTYNVIVQLGNCIPDTASVDVIVNALPTIDAGFDQEIFEGGEIQLLALSGGGNYNWQPPNGLSNTTIFNPIASPDSNTNYIVTLTDANGCSASDTVLISILSDDAQLIFPNAFSPNGDGINDKLEYFAKNISNLDLKIYNRWGQLLFESKLIGEYWNGVYKKIQQPIGVYVFVATATTRSGKEIITKGNFTILK